MTEKVITVHCENVTHQIVLEEGETIGYAGILDRLRKHPYNLKIPPFSTLKYTSGVNVNLMKVFDRSYALRLVLAQGKRRGKSQRNTRR